jgi:hypothetical protein
MQTGKYHGIAPATSSALHTVHTYTFIQYVLENKPNRAASFALCHFWRQNNDKNQVDNAIEFNKRTPLYLRSISVKLSAF